MAFNEVTIDIFMSLFKHYIMSVHYKKKTEKKQETFIKTE